MLIATEHHDLMTILSSLFAIPAVLGVIAGIIKNHKKAYVLSGVICVMLLILNNYIYYSGNYIEYLPLLQKISFAIFLAWVIGLNIEIIRDAE